MDAGGVQETLWMHFRGVWTAAIRLFDVVINLSAGDTFPNPA